MLTRDLVLVLGVPRSGTSALTRVLSLCGCSLPGTVFGATDLNPTGHWESVEATNMNVEFMSRLGIMDDPRMRLEEGDVNASDRESYLRQIETFLSSCSQGVTLIKEARLNELTQFWLEAAHRAGFSVKMVIAIRHPQEVFASAKAAVEHPQEDASRPAQTLALEKFNTLWLKMNLLAERHSRDHPRVFIEYSNLLKDWRTEVARVSKALTLTLKPDERRIDDFLTADLHRKRHSGPVTETFAYSWTTRVYAILSSAAQDRPVDFASLDEIYHAYRTNARAFSLSANDSTDSALRLHEFVNRLPIWKGES